MKHRSSRNRAIRVRAVARLLSLTVLIFGAAAQSAPAVDVSGQWELTVGGGFPAGGRVDALDLEQTGSALRVFVPSVATSFAGTIDPLTGAIHLEYGVLVFFEPLAMTVDGFAAGDGETMVGTYVASVSGTPLGSGPIEGRRTGPLLPRCGNGVVEPGEACEGTCCRPDCTGLEAPGAACADDGNECTGDVCDAAGICRHPEEDGGACGPGAPFEVGAGDALERYCTPRGTCRAGVCLPTVCRLPSGGSRIDLRNTGTGLPLRWHWSATPGAAPAPSFGDPLRAGDGTGYRLCFLAPGGGFLASVPPGPGWRARVRQDGVRYRRPPGSDVDFVRVDLVASPRRESVDVALGAPGMGPMPFLANPLTPVRLRLVGLGQPASCFEASYGQPDIDGPRRFRARR